MIDSNGYAREYLRNFYIGRRWFIQVFLDLSADPINLLRIDVNQKRQPMLTLTPLIDVNQLFDLSDLPLLLIRLFNACFDIPNNFAAWLWF
jgi:hypothetical protein